MPTLIDPEAAAVHLAAADPVMSRLIAQAGPFELRQPAAAPFQALSRSIIFQQLSGTAAGTIYGRFVTHFRPEHLGPAGAWDGNPHDFPEPLEVLAASDEALRAVGLSRQKVAAVRSLAEHFSTGDLGQALFQTQEDEEVIARLTQVRGIGRWTAEMFLMFQLRRADVLPVNDVGINRAIMRQYSLQAMPAPAEVQRIGAPWRPHASVACWYLWRSEDVKN